MVKLFLFSLSFCVLSSCTPNKQDAKTNSPEDAPTYFASETFNYSITSVNEITLKPTWNGIPLKNKVISLYKGDPLTNGSLITKVITDKNGVVTLLLKYNVLEDKIYYHYSYLGQDYVVLINNETSCFNLQKKSLLSLFLNFFFEATYANTACINTNAPWDSKFNFLAQEYTTDGRPNNVERTGLSEISSGFLDRIDISLPERSPVPEYHPEFIAQGAYTNLHVIEQAEVWITYLSEGAGYKNLLGYYTYPTGDPPETTDDIETLHIIFPNVSNSGSGGSLLPGDRVKLGTFEPGTTIAYFLIANGWVNHACAVFQNSNYILFSNPHLNPENVESLRQHNVLFYDEIEEKIVIGFEDLIRTRGSDEDFNDAIFYIQSNPISAIDVSNIAPIDETDDQDGDGIDDDVDDFPNDPTKAFNNYYPTISTNGTLMFEDLWPSMGDYDFNDLVLYYNYNYVTNANADVVEININYSIVATGAGQQNGFGIQLPIDNNLVKSVTGQELTTNSIVLQENGVETNQSKAVIIITDNVNSNFPPFGNVFGRISSPYHNISIQIILEDGVHISQIGLPPYDPFLIKNGIRETEIHQMNKSPTQRGSHKYFGRFDDSSNISSSIFYRTTNHLPWVLNIPEEVMHARERVPLFNAYHFFTIWASSEGRLHSDWYTQNARNYNYNKLIKK